MRNWRITLAGLVLVAITGWMVSTAEEPAPKPKTVIKKELPKKAAPAKEAVEEAVPAEADADEAAPADAPALKTVEDRFSYGIGLNIGRDFAGNGVSANPELIARGIADIMAKRKPLLTEEEVGEAMQAMTEILKEQRAARSEKNLKAGEEFLAANAKRKGVTTTKSGLQYEVVKAGKGASPKATDTVSAHYHGTLIDGSVFDSSVERGEPLEIPVGGVIPGWTEALQLMKVGDKWKIYLPSKLAYGAEGSPPKIGPHSALVFDIELLEVKGSEKKE